MRLNLKMTGNPTSYEVCRVNSTEEINTEKTHHSEKSTKIKVRRVRNEEQLQKEHTLPYHCQSTAAIRLHYGHSRVPRAKREMFCKHLFLFSVLLSALCSEYLHHEMFLNDSV